MNPQQIETVWALLAQTWGSRFLDQYGTRPNDAWQAMLANVEPDAARAAYQALVLSGSPHPPTLPEFLAEARRFARTRTLAARNAEVLASLPPPDPERARENLRRLRAALNG